MKYLKILTLVLSISFVFASCTKKEDNIAAFEGNKFETTYFKMVTTGDLATVVESSTIADLKSKDMYSVVELWTDGSVYNDGEKSGSWVQSGSLITISGIESETFSGTIDGKSIVLKSENENISIEIHFTKL